VRFGKPRRCPHPGSTAGIFLCFGVGFELSGISALSNGSSLPDDAILILFMSKGLLGSYVPGGTVALREQRSLTSSGLSVSLPKVYAGADPVLLKVSYLIPSYCPGPNGFVILLSAQVDTPLNIPSLAVRDSDVFMVHFLAFSLVVTAPAQVWGLSAHSLGFACLVMSLDEAHRPPILCCAACEWYVGTYLAFL